MGEPSAVEQTQQQVEGKRPRGDVPATTTEVDLAAAQAHAQWWSPDLRSKMEASPSEAAGGDLGLCETALVAPSGDSPQRHS